MVFAREGFLSIDLGIVPSVDSGNGLSVDVLAGMSIDGNGAGQSASCL